MKRKILKHLAEWLDSPEKKPLILRGARQTGKTYVVRQFAKESGRNLIELNFEKNPEYAEAFYQNDSKKIISELELVFNTEINPDNCILFLDEIQVASFILSRLRWFYEELPYLPVIAAGSLLEFALFEYQESMPVGRVTYMYLHPFSFVEFLWAMGEERLAENLSNVVSNLDVSDVLHKKYIELYRQYTIIGGMPAVVKKWKETKSVFSCIDLQKDILTSYRDDFNKYRNRVPSEILRKTMNSVVYQLGETFNYSSIDRETKHTVIKQALEMLEKAGLCKKIYHSASNGIPLGAEKNDRIFKVAFLDSGIAMSILGLCPVDIEKFEETLWAKKGAMAEQLVAQLMQSARYKDNDEMFFWQQTGSGSGEIDYMLQNENKVLPVEVKSGVSGKMKSLHSFMESKKLKLAIRFDLNPPSRQTVSVKTNQGKNVEYELVSYPIYCAETVFCDFNNLMLL